MKLLLLYVANLWWFSVTAVAFGDKANFPRKMQHFFSILLVGEVVPRHVETSTVALHTKST